MTTLPQTSPMRLPRPNPSQLAIPSAQGHPLPPRGDAAASGLTAQDVWRVIRANLWLIIGLMVVGGVSGYFLNRWLEANYPKYTSTVLVTVKLPSQLPVVGGDDTRMFSVEPGAQSIELEQQSQASMLTNRYFLGNIIANKDSAIRKTNWFKWYEQRGRVEDAKEELATKLEVYPRPNTNMIAVSFAAGSPGDALTIVKEIVGQHVKERTANIQDLQLSQQANYSQLISGYQTELANVRQSERAQSDIMASYGASGGSNATNGLALQLATVLQAQNKAEAEFMKADSDYRDFVKQVESGGTPLKLQEELSRVSQGAGQNTDLIEQELEAAKIQSGPESKQVKQLQTRLETARKQAEEQSAKRREDMISTLKVDLYRNAEVAQRVLNSYKEQLGKINEYMQKESAAEIQLVALRKQEENLLARLQKAEQQQRSLSLAIQSNSWSTAAMYGDADLPNAPTFPKLSITLTLSITLGLALALGIAFLRELMDTSVRSPRDIAKVGQLNLLGMIPHESDDPEAQTARLPLAIYEAPTSIIAEQFRQVRTRLQHSASLDTVRSLMVTGTAPGDGKTTVACNLAAGLALNGRRILLVDANFRRPQIHAVLNIPNEVGFGDVLNSLDLFESAVRETEVPNLAVLPTGVKPANSTELLESQLLIDFIERALEEYDHVIFDSGPLLLVSETSALAPRVDGVVTVVRARGNSRGMLQRLRDQLRQLKAENLGVILNAVRSQSGGYYAPMIKSYYAYQQNG